MVEWIVIK